ncbi:hypothetical protein GALMADRAFT_68048 [Galerina marginata CBS 339.88]|uniref:SUN domain-containing protein n=1 Tax=Galerina marginata (strain CBS 339.88) TaxID=685588 RepID=A0A067T8H5_GALM3|nr:hypothetical protein GALMADRAFT_68048 [Galerina marginata CBS 339.88]
MSFSGTPLGQGRRLDHHTFLGKPPSNGSVPPPSYAYGAPALGSRSPPKPTSPTRTRNHIHDPEEVLGEENEPALLRFAKLKQRESAGDLSSRPGGPKTQTSPLKPEKWAYKDTTVNIANAFVQAASGADMSASYNNPHNNSWASSSSREKAHLPRHTSEEFEQNAAQASKKRLAAPPDKLGRAPISTTRKPPSKSTSLLHVPDSEGEGDARGLNGRAKSPLEHGITFAKNALGAAAFYVRQRSREPEDHSLEHPPANGDPNGNDSSYDYAAEEQAFQAQKRNNATHKRNRMSVDNKAYKPSQSDEEESEYSDDGKTKRRRKKKKGPVGGPLTTLPVVGSDKRRRRKGHGSKGNLGGPDEYESESDENTQMDNQSQFSQPQPSVARTSNPPLSRVSASRFSQEPPEHDPDDSMLSANQGLDSIPEIEETLLPTEPFVRQSSQQRRGRSRTPAPQTPSSFSVGGLLGSIVHVIIKLSLWIFSGLLSVLSMFTFLFGQVFGTAFDIILRRPVGWARSAGPLVKYLTPALTLLCAWYILQGASLSSYLPSLTFPNRSPVYQAPVAPPADISAIVDRLLRIESVLSGLSLDTERTKAKAEDSIKGYSGLLEQISNLEGRLAEETKKVKDTESKAREAVGRSINGIKQEVEVLEAQLIAQQKQHEKAQRTPTDISDTDARAKLKLLEDRVGSVEVGVKEALELGKKPVAPPSAAPVPGAAWWSKLSGPKSVLQIKSTDGQDVSALLSHMVDSAVSRINKDGIAKADYALHSGGARVIPRLTSDVLEIKPRGLGSQLVSLVTGNGGYIAHPPAMALHPDLHSGRCWPFAGSHGMLGVALVAPIIVEEVTVDHIAAEVAFDMRSAPQDMEVWGMVDGQDNLDRVQAWRAERAANKEAPGQQDTDVDEAVAYPPELPKHPEFIRLANFTYDIHAPSNVQTFPVDPEIKALGVDFGIVVLRVLSNWGRDEFTCLYRFRVHGERLGELPGPLFGDGSS